MEATAQNVNEFFTGVFSEAARSSAFAAYAKSEFKKIDRQNERVAGHHEPHITIVDGVRGASEDSVKPNGKIVYIWETSDANKFSDVLGFIRRQLIEHSPVGDSGLYSQSHLMFADGILDERQFDTLESFGTLRNTNAEEYVFVNAQPYARKIERGESPQFPDGVYEAVAKLAADQFPESDVQFTYASPISTGALEAWARGSTLSSTGHASIRNRAEWLRRQPAIIVKATEGI